MNRLKTLLTIAVSLASTPVLAGQVRVPMVDKGLATFYVPARIEGLQQQVDFMVDTGSGYVTINEKTLKRLKTRGNVEYVKDLVGVLADGSELHVPVYRLARLDVGSCAIENVEAAVFPGKTRNILGLSALSKAAPFVFSIDPAELVLTCHPRGQSL